MDMLINQDLEIDGDIFGRNLVEKIANARNIEERKTIFEEAYSDLVKNMSDNNCGKNIAEYVKQSIIKTKGQITVNELSEETGYSLCYLRRNFKEYFGISPKQFSQFIRFQNLLNLAENSQSRFDDLSLQCGYYDEAHMMKEFKTYTGITLKNYLSKIENIETSVF